MMTTPHGDPREPQDAGGAPQVDSPAQSLCVACGLCCDGTLYERAPIKPDDDPVRLAAAAFVPQALGDRQFFQQPCHHLHHRVCQLYRDWRPNICHSFRCRLLSQLDAGEIGIEAARALVTGTTRLADRVWTQLRQRVGDTAGRPLKVLIQDWMAAQEASGNPAWRREHAAFLLDYGHLQVRLTLEFRDPPKERSVGA